jgi:histone-lysine N-methyltransferase SETD2
LQLQQVMMLTLLHCTAAATGDELTFDYNFERYGDKPMRCFCDSKRCRKFIGGTQETTANIVELGDAEDVTNDPEPVLVQEHETDGLVQAMLDKEVGTTQRGWDTKLLNRCVRCVCVCV